MQEDDHQDSSKSSKPDSASNPPKKGRLKRWFGRSAENTPEAENTGALNDQAILTANSAEHEVVEIEAMPPSVDSSLEPSRTGLLAKISHVFKGSFDLDDDLFEELEELLISSDIGVDASLQLVEELRIRVKAEKIQTAEGVIKGLKTGMGEILTSAETSWKLTHQPHVVLVVGVNGVGKTTTTAKIANHFSSQGKKVMLAAADTFRAAAVEQLQEWGKRLDIPVIAQGHGADAAAVAHDAIMAAKAREMDILLIDTAGRLHTQSNLMEQLEKVTRVIQKIDPTTPHEVIQVLDAGTGQNAISQLEHFKDSTNVTSVCITKLDGSAKGGVALGIATKFALPIRFIGIGEGINDLKPFNAIEYADALIGSPVSS